MTHPASWLCLLALGWGCLTTYAREYEGARANSLLLNGAWEFVCGDGNEGAETDAGQRGLHWQEVKLPGPFMAWSQEAANQTKFAWARRPFSVTATQAQSLPVLRWNRIACGAAAFVNGQKVGENEPTGPFQVILPPGVLKPGENQIVLKICGAAGVRRSQSGNALIPAGFGVGLPEVTDDVWLDFSDMAYMKWVLALPELASSRVRIRVTLAGWFKEAGDRATTCTEYMNYFGHPRAQWTGVDHQTANALAVAQIGAEHTEAMRRARLDGIWPYMYAGWTRTRLAARVRETGKGSAVWKANYAAPEVGGRILFAQLDVQDRLDPSKPNYDPVAERLLLNLLCAAE